MSAENRRSATSRYSTRAGAAPTPFWHRRNGGKVRRALIAVPMRSELRPVVKLVHARPHQVDGRTVYAGRVGMAQVQIVQIGVGPASARRVTGWALKQFR